MKLLFAGGGSLGPVSPLLATVRAIQRVEKNVQVQWVGTPDGPEHFLVETQGIPFQSLPVVKLPRYPSLRWLTFPFAWLRVRGLAGVLLDLHKPDAVIAAGGFTETPLMIEAARRGIPCVIHQLDLKPSLSNRRVARLCASVTTSFEYERPPFGQWVADERIPTPTRFRKGQLPTRASAAKHFGLDPERSILLIFGGGTGAQALNEHVARTKKQWLGFTQLIHLTGKGKNQGMKGERGYVVRDLLIDDMDMAYAAADIVVSRAGFATLSEMTAALSMPTIVVPLPGTEQESNAKAFEEQGGVVVVEQSHPRFDDELLSAAKLMLSDKDIRREMGEQAFDFMPTDDGAALAKRILKVISQTTQKKR